MFLFVYLLVFLLEILLELLRFATGILRFATGILILFLFEILEESIHAHDGASGQVTGRYLLCL